MNYQLGYSTNQLIEMFIKEIDVNDGSRKNYEFSLRKFIQFLFKVKECIIYGEENVLYGVRRNHILDYKKLLLHTKSPATTDNYLTSVRLFFTWLFNNEFIRNNYAYGIKSPRRRREYKKRALTLDQLKQLMLTCDRSTFIGKRDYAIICLMSIQGFRRAEVMNIQYQDITNEMVDGTNEVGIWIKGKGYSDKQFTSLSTTTWDALEAYLVEFSNIESSQYIFIGNGNNNNFNRLTDIYISILIKKKLNLIGLDSKAYSCHSLRHTAATLLLKQNGISIIEVKSLLRHKNITTTEIYTNTLEKENIVKNTGAKKLGKLFECINDNV